VSKITIVIADDHPLFARGLRQALTEESQFEVAGEAADGEAAILLIEQCRPDVAILDVDMPKQDGLQVVRAIRERRLATAAIFLTMHQNESLLQAALDLGVRGYVLKDSALSEVAASVRAIAAGRDFVSPALAGYLFDQRSRKRALFLDQPALNDLTPGERRVLLLIAECRSNAEIAEALFLSTRTVENHRAHICAKLNLRGREALLRFAIAHRSELL